MTPFEIATLKHGDVESIRLRGHLVLGQPVDDLHQKMDNLATHSESQFVFNLEDVARIDSSGVLVLNPYLRQGSRRLPQTRQSLPPSQTGLADVLRPPTLRLFSDEQQAIASFSQT